MKKVTIISGGASGLGFELASGMLKAGKSVIILGRDGEKLKTAASKLRDLYHNCDIETLKCNIGTECEVKKLGDHLVSRQLVTEYLFNNAGMGLFVKSDSLTSAMIDKVFEANLKGMILLTTEILRMTPQDEELTIANIMSTSALIGRAEETIYCAAKFGARGFTEALRVELKGTKRNIIAVYPGGMRTDFWKMPGIERNLSTFMDPAIVAEKIVNAVLLSDKTLVTDITINRR